MSKEYELMMKEVEILLVESNKADVDYTKETINTYNLKNNLHIVDNGEDAMDFLYKRNQYKSVPTPDIIILSLNLPKKDGREVLIEIKHNDELKNIPVVVLTASGEEKDISMVYGDYANCCITKPIDFKQFERILKSLNNFWLSLFNASDEKYLVSEEGL